MRRVFADTFYWLGLVNQHDQWHRHVRTVTASMGRLQFYTTDEVVVETLAGLAGSGVYLRQLGVSIVRHLLSSNGTVVLPQSRQTLLAGLQLYEERPDKRYSMTDCISMCAMRQHALTDVLTNDAHFSQEGFNVLIPAR